MAVSEATTLLDDAGDIYQRPLLHNKGTILYLNPRHQSTYYNRATAVEHGPGVNGLTWFMLTLNLECFEHVTSHWDAVPAHLDEYLDRGDRFMNARQHDELLIDDESFTRSRKYFWPLSTLGQFEETLR